MVNTLTGNIILDCQIKTSDSWVAGLDFLWDSNEERALSAMVLPKKNINNLHVELGHLSKTTTHITAKAIGIQVTGTFKPCEDCALGKTKQWAVSNEAVPQLQILGKRLFFNISSLSTPTFRKKHHWLLVIDDCSNYSWSFFLKEKSDLAETMLGSVINLKLNLICRYYTSAVTIQARIKPLMKPANRIGWGSTLNIQPQVCLNKMVMSSASLLPISTRNVPCSMVASLPPIYEAGYGQMLQTLPSSSRTIWSHPTGP